MMNLLDRDELFKKIEDNKKKYKLFIERSMAIDSDYQKNFPKDESIDKIIQYNIEYEKMLRVLSDEKDKLDSEWIELKKELDDLIKA